MTSSASSNASKREEEEDAALALASLSNSNTSTGACNRDKTSSNSTNQTIEADEEMAPGSAHPLTRYSSSSGFRIQQIPFPRVIHQPMKLANSVDHTYTDYSVIPDNVLSLLEEGSQQYFLGLDADQRRGCEIMKEQLKTIFGKSAPSRKHNGGVSKPFPGKLIDVLEMEEAQSCIAWMPHGRSFKVFDQDKLVSEILTKHFKQSKMVSFTRQLNLWGFKRITKGIDAGAYYNERFLKGYPRLATLMKRHKNKGTGTKLASNPDSEPNFYMMPRPGANPPEVSISSNGSNRSGHNSGVSGMLSNDQVLQRLLQLRGTPTTVPNLVGNTTTSIQNLAWNQNDVNSVSASNTTRDSNSSVTSDATSHDDLLVASRQAQVNSTGRVAGEQGSLNGNVNQQSANMNSNLSNILLQIQQQQRLLQPQNIDLLSLLGLIQQQQQQQQQQQHQQLLLQLQGFEGLLQPNLAAMPSQLGNNVDINALRQSLLNAAAALENFDTSKK